MAGVDVPARCLPSTTDLLDDEEDWTVVELVDVDAEERVRVECRLRNLQESCCVRMQKILESVVEGVGLAVVLLDAAAVMLPGVAGIPDSRIENLCGYLASMRVEVILLTSMLYDLKEVRDKTRLDHVNLLRNLQVEAKRHRGVLAASGVVLFLATIVFCCRLERLLKRLMNAVPVMPLR